MSIQAESWVPPDLENQTQNLLGEAIKVPDTIHFPFYK